jgi:hypothetical protein
MHTNYVRLLIVLLRSWIKLYSEVVSEIPFMDHVAWKALMDEMKSYLYSVTCMCLITKEMGHIGQFLVIGHF